MNVQDLLKNASSLTDYEFEQQLNRLVRENYRYKNLDAKNRKLILDVVKKYRTYLKKGIPISSTSISNETYRLYKKREKLGLTEEDLKDIKEILKEFRK